MSLLEDILGTIREDAPVQRVSAGRNWIALKSRHCGLASTLGSGDDATSIDIQSLGGRSARDVAHLALSENPLDAAVGMAAVNSLIDVDESLCEERNGRDIILENAQEKSVVLVGHFPFVPRIAASCRTSFRAGVAPPTRRSAGKRCVRVDPKGGHPGHHRYRNRESHA